MNFGTGRVYFTQNGTELTDHPANGLAYLGRGSFVAKFENVKNGMVFDFLEVGGKDGKVYGLFPDAFDGPVKVKFWFPKDEDFDYTETAGFASKSDAIAAGATDSGYDNGHCERDGRGVDFQGWNPWEEYLAKV